MELEDKRVITKEKRHMGMKKKRAIFDSITYAILVLMSIIWLIPFVFIFVESFRSDGATWQVGDIFSHKWGFDNYISLFKDTDFGKWYLNTFLIAMAAAVLQTIVVLCVSYTLSRLRFKGRKMLMNVCLVLGMFPGFLSLIILYNVLSDMGLTGPNAVPGLILIGFAGAGMGYYISKGYFDTIPRSLDEAARVDGANKFQVFYKVIMPLAKPIVIYTVLTAFMGPWGDFMFAKYIANGSSAGMNVAVGLNTMIASSGSLSAHYTEFCAGGVLVAIPIAVLFMFLQRYYVEGVTGGAVKG
jgi:arabinogalactan oligomer/maltooligosaccharide transport system permease protein